MNVPDFKFENFTFPAGEGTPSLNLNKDQGLIEIQGVSIPEDTLKFYAKFNEWLYQYCASPSNSTTVNLGLIYLNSSSTVIVTGMIKALDKLANTGHSVTINWYYEEGDEEMKDLGEMYASESSCNIVTHEVPEEE